LWQRFDAVVKAGQWDSTWHSHPRVVKTIIDMYGLGKFGVARVDTAPTLTGLIDPLAKRPAPPAFGTKLVQPTPPSPRPAPVPTPPWKGSLNKPLADVVLNGGKTLPAPADASVSLKRPKPPAAIAWLVSIDASRPTRRRQRPADW
jgi:hypothetical protein